MIKNYTTLLFLLGTILLGTAQPPFKGKVLDANTQQAIEFVNIGVIGSNKGRLYSPLRSGKKYIWEIGALEAEHLICFFY